MSLPFQQLDADFIRVASKIIAFALGIDRRIVIGMAVDLVDFSIEATGTESRPPDGVFLDPDAPAMLENVMGWTGEAGKCISAFIRAGVLEKLEIGIRVRGMDRYARAWMKKKRPGPSKREDGSAGQTPDKRRTYPSPSISEEDVSSSEGVQGETPEQLQAAWNENTSAPLPKCKDIDARKAAMAAALARRPVAQWREVFARIQASPYCRGEKNGWVANFDWAIRKAGQKPETAQSVLEGAYDSHAPPAIARGTGPSVGRGRAPPMNFNAEDPFGPPEAA